MFFHSFSILSLSRSFNLVYDLKSIAFYANEMILAKYDISLLVNIRKYSGNIFIKLS